MHNNYAHFPNMCAKFLSHINFLSYFLFPFHCHQERFPKVAYTQNYLNNTGLKYHISKIQLFFLNTHKIEIMLQIIYILTLFFR